MRIIRPTLAIPLAVVLIASFSEYASAGSEFAGPPDYQHAFVALAFLMPAGFALLAAAGNPSERVWDILLSALLALGIGCMIYWTCGFAFQFGALGLWHSNSAYAGLNLHWSALGPEYGRTWGMLGLQGFFLSKDVATPAVYRLFVAQLPLVATAIMIPLLALRGRASRGAVFLSGLLMAAVVFPLLGNWTWGGGWLAQLGAGLGYGHGLVDVGGAGAVHLAAATFALVGLFFLPRRRANGNVDGPRLPAAHLPALGVLGALTLPVAWCGVVLSQPWLPWETVSVDLTLLNLLLAAGAGALLPGLYTWFVAGRLDALMVARGLAAGLVAISASAPFIEPEASLFLGALAGLAIPLISYLVNEVIRLDDPGGVVSMHGIGGLIGLLAPALFATGRYGIGWNGVGVEGHLGVIGQGVTGLLAAPGFQPDWPGQLLAQAAGAGSFVALPAVLGLLLFSSERLLTTLRARPKTKALPDLSPSATDSETALGEPSCDQVSGPESTIQPEDPPTHTAQSSSTSPADAETISPEH